MSNLDDNKQIARRWLELVSEGRLDELCVMTAPTWLLHGAPARLPRGPAGLRALFRSFGHIEQQWTVEHVIAEGDKVAVRATNSCVQDNFLGIPANGRRQTFTATFIHTIVDGRVVETWRNADDLDRILQLGARIEARSHASETGVHAMNVTYRGTVYPSQCDHMGHMNVMWYAAKFDEASWQLAAALGLTAARFKREGTGMAAVDQHIEYKRELRAGDVVTIRSSVLDVREKSIRLLHEMRNDETGEVAAISILVGVHLDTTGRQARTLPSDIRERATRMIAEREGDAGAGDDTFALALDCVPSSVSDHSG
jgi:acyl-CoA thioesterase FadM/ketosteroid isomerase-like protein